MKIAVINGPKLNQLGTRSPEIYGHLTLSQIEYGLKKEFEFEHELSFFQSDTESELVKKIQSFDGEILVINGGAFSHHSINIHNALKKKDCYKVEIHISNVFQREEFRHKSAIASVCNAYIAGFGTNGYSLAIKGALANLTKKQ
ncbi:MAG: type II 3-dehydroquinate dehydratase [Firmicutes bacterium]|nr:type II 3-dehydroquinate dehydratase [Bacillota bacterium]MCL2256179.1 type II 3-dehydroquinate dehydratase [Bacillota bacterium]